MINLKQSSNLYLIEIGDTIFITNNEQDIIINNIIYEAGVSLGDLSFNSISSNFQDISFDIFLKNEDILKNNRGNIIIKKIQKDSSSSIVYRGFLLEYQKINKYQFTIICRHIVRKLESNIGDFFSLNCRNKLGDSRCKIDLERLKMIGAILKVLSINSFVGSHTIKITQYFQFGKIILDTGEIFEITDNSNPLQISFINNSNYQLKINQNYTIHPGCNKNLEHCSTKFQNAINFNGEPFIN